MRDLDVRNPFGVSDAPDPGGQDVLDFASQSDGLGAADDRNAGAWMASISGAAPRSVEGEWFSRWNGGADPTIAGDAPANWKPGKARIVLADERLYVLFDWADGARQALIEARPRGHSRWAGRYLNLSNPAIQRPWVGLVVDNCRIDGRWTNGRLDFRR